MSIRDLDIIRDIAAIRTIADPERIAILRLSQVLTQGLQTTFSDLIAKYRVGEVKRRLLERQNGDLTHAGAALESGFSSKSSFYRLFKQHTGMTPAVFIKVMGDDPEEEEPQGPESDRDTCMNGAETNGHSARIDKKEGVVMSRIQGPCRWRTSGGKALYHAVLGLAGVAAFAGLAAHSAAQEPILDHAGFLPGDAQIALSVEVQDEPRIAASNLGYLAVWEDLRPVISGVINTSLPLSGNETDIYAARLDTNGNVLDAVVVTNQGRNQVKPDVASNGQDYLVVWESQRPDWYFFDDIMAARISADGQLLDPEPIPVRLAQSDPANDQGSDPAVASDGTNWVIIWGDIDWTTGPNVVARRLAPDGSWIDPAPIVLYQHPEGVFGPIYPRIAFNGSIFLMVYERGGQHEIFGRRFDADLNPLDPAPFSIGAGEHPNVAASGSDFLVLARNKTAFRVASDGTVLDPTPIVLGIPSGFAWRAPDAAWDGSEWVVAGTGDGDVWEVRLGANGTVQSAQPITADPGNQQYMAAVDSDGNGSTEVVWTLREGTESRESIVGALVASGVSPVAQDISTGLPRQSYIRFATQGGTHAATFMTQSHGETRIVIQRVDAQGQPIDNEPVEVWSATESDRVAPEITVLGTDWVVGWTSRSTVYARRFTFDLLPIDPIAIPILTDAAGQLGIAALGDELYIAYTHTFSGDQRTLKGVRVDGSDLSVIGSAATIGIGYALSPTVVALGGRWLTVYERQVRHDILTSTIRGIFVEPDGTFGAPYILSTGDDDRPDVAVVGDRALIVSSEHISPTDDAIQARLIDSTGAILSGEITIADANREQLFPAVAWTGEYFAVAWTDYRRISGVEALRGDIYVARLDIDGNVVDIDGMPVTDDSLPEDLPALAGADGVAVIGFSQLHGLSSPEVQRISVWTLRELATSEASEGLPLQPSLRIGPNPFTDRVGILLQQSPQAADGDWKAEIFSTDGRRVWARSIAPGEAAIWDGLDVGGGAAASGVYYLHVSDRQGVEVSRRIVRIE